MYVYCIYSFLKGQAEFTVKFTFLSMAMDIFWFALALIFSVAFTVVIAFSPKKNLPPSPLALPVIGHLHLIKTPLHQALQTLSAKYGPIMYLRFGCRHVLVVSSPSAAEQCLSDHADVVLANRPASLATKYLSYNNTSLGFAPYGDHWRNLRRLTSTLIFSSVSLHRSAAVRNQEVRFLARKLFQGCNGSIATNRKINLSRTLYELLLNVMTATIAGKQCSMLDGMPDVTTFTNMCDYIPVLRWVGFKGMEKNLVNIHRKRDEFVQVLLDEYRRNRDGFSSNKERKMMIEYMLSLQEAEPEYYTDILIKGLLQIMYTAGTHTTSITMVWVMSLLLNYPEAMEKARKEIDNNVEPGRLLEDADLPKLPYLKCIINETLRLFPVAPLLLPHASSQSCTIEGFDIPEGTMMFVNAWAIHRDPGLWNEPDKFKPERFEGFGDEKRCFKFIPFGMGRRACPGASMGMRIMGLALGLLIQCFEWERVRAEELVDLTAASGGPTLRKAEPLEVMYRPRSTMLGLLSQL